MWKPFATGAFLLVLKKLMCLIYIKKKNRVSITKISHGYNSSHGSPADYPIDEAGNDTGRDYFYCPCDEMVVKKIYGTATGKSCANGVWLESTSKCDLADGTRDYVTVKFVHMNDSDFGRNGIYVGRVYKRNEAIGREGTSGNATGNHVHITSGKGKLKGSGWVKNTKGAWVLTTTNGAREPEKLFYIDKSFTKIIQTKGIEFKNKPEEYTTRDGVTALQIASRLKQATKEQMKKYDFDGDGKISMKDAVVVLQKVAGLK